MKCPIFTKNMSGSLAPWPSCVGYFNWKKKRVAGKSITATDFLDLQFCLDY